MHLFHQVRLLRTRRYQTIVTAFSVSLVLVQQPIGLCRSRVHEETHLADSNNVQMPRAGLRNWGPHAKGSWGPPLLSLPFPLRPSPLPLPFPSLQSSPLPYLPSSSLPCLRSRPPKYSYGVWGSTVSSPNGVWGEAPAEKGFGAYLSQKGPL